MGKLAGIAAAVITTALIFEGVLSSERGRDPLNVDKSKIKPLPQKNTKRGNRRKRRSK